jgi:hypothetical protein
MFRCDFDVMESLEESGETKHSPCKSSVLQFLWVSSHGAKLLAMKCSGGRTAPSVVLSKKKNET